MSVVVGPGRVGVMPAWPGRDQELVRVECLPAAPAPLDPLDDGEDYVPGAARQDGGQVW